MAAGGPQSCWQLSQPPCLHPCPGRRLRAQPRCRSMHQPLVRNTRTSLPGCGLKQRHGRQPGPYRSERGTGSFILAAAAADAPPAPAEQQAHHNSAAKDGKQHQHSHHTAPEVPDNLRKQVAVLTADNPSAPGGKTTVYVLGMSHVSKRSVEDIKQLIQHVKPEVAVIELCRDRVGLLVPRKSQIKYTQLWFAPDILLEGIPKDEGWPSADALQKLLRSQPFASLSTHDIESDCQRLLATGLFASVRPLLKPPATACAPQMLERSDTTLVASIPAGMISYTVQPRTALPRAAEFTARIDSSLGGGSLPEEQVREIGEGIVKACSEGTPTITACLQARARVEDLARQSLPSTSTQSTDIEVVFRGIHTGAIEAVIKAAPPAHERLPFSSGFEASAPGGEGPGIERFRAYRGSVELSPRMTIDNIANIMPISSESVDDVLGPVPTASHASNGTGEPPKNETSQTSWRVWSNEERKLEAEEAEREEEEEEKKPSPWEKTVNQFGEWLTTTYAEFQGKAGDKVGVPPGEAWRASVQAAADAGAAQVHLGDLPASISGRRLAEGVLKGVGARLAAALALTAGLVGANAVHKLPEGPAWAAPAAAAAAWLAALYSLGGPFLEVFLFSRSSPEQVEEAVRVREPLQGGAQGMYRLRGEDAIISFPSAARGVIQDRDVYMARTLRAAATGESASPALVLDSDSSTGGRKAWRYMMPAAAADRESLLQDAVPFVGGEGIYEPLQGVSRVVGVVGTAHVRGIIEHWEEAASQGRMVEVLKKE